VAILVQKCRATDLELPCSSPEISLFRVSACLVNDQLCGVLYSCLLNEWNREMRYGVQISWTLFHVVVGDVSKRQL
jgi:hypothetical protein